MTTLTSLLLVLVLIALVVVWVVWVGAQRTEVEPPRPVIEDHAFVGAPYGPCIYLYEGESDFEEDTVCGLYAEQHYPTPTVPTLRRRVEEDAPAVREDDMCEGHQSVDARHWVACNLPHGHRQVPEVDEYEEALRRMDQPDLVEGVDFFRFDDAGEDDARKYRDGRDDED